MSAEPHRRPSETTDTVAGFLCAFAIFFAAIGVIWHPLRLIPISYVLVLIATAMVGDRRRLTRGAAAIVAVCFVAGMVVAVLANKPLW
jgi:hypothetical protein